MCVWNSYLLRCDRYASESRERAMTAVIFDAFGTLAQITEKTYPYRAILKEGARQGRQRNSDDRYKLLAENHNLNEVAEVLNIQLSASQLIAIEQKIVTELRSIRAFEDGIEAVNLLQNEGIKVGVCSNLSAPYGECVRNLFPSLDAYGFSYELGFVKPDPEIFLLTCKAMGVDNTDFFGKGRVLVIGDSRRCDLDGARAALLNGYLLDRDGFGNFSNLMGFAEAVVQSEQRFW